MSLSRRRFLHGALSGAAVVSLSGAVPSFLQRTAAAESAKPAAAGASAGASRATDRVLVVLQLSGGNDGLNTVIPYKDDRYYKNRPSLAANPRQVIKLNDHLALNPAMPELGKLWQDKALTVIEGVGYPNPSRSHFVSMDIWHSARPEKPTKLSGWLGRALQADPARRLGSGRTTALSLGSRELPPALVGEGVHVPAVEDLSDFRLRIEGSDASDQQSRRAAIRDFAAAPRELAQRTAPGSADSELAFVSDTMKTTFAAAESLAELTAAAKDRVSYPGDSLGRALRQAGQVIAAGFGTRVFYCSLGGFDTHARQLAAHPILLGRVSAAVGAFCADMKALGRAKDVTVMTFSEFGRRVEQNASHGTDHGTAAPMFLAGGAVAGGVVGEAPDLANLVEGGDLKFQFDFRRVYATLLDRWLGIDSSGVLGDRFEPIDGLLA